MNFNLGKKLLILLLAVQLPVTAYLMVQWTSMHGFWGGLWFWYSNGVNDPIYSAAEIDFLVLILIVGALVLADWKSLGRKFNFTIVSWAVLFFLFPSLGLALYLLFLRKASKVQTSSDF